MSVVPLKAPAAMEPWLTQRQLAERLGVSEGWIYLRRREGLPHHRWAGILRFRMSEVERWLNERSAA